MPTVASGHTIREVATGGLLGGQILDGIVADPVSGNIYVAGVDNIISTSFNLFKITPAGVVSLVGNFPFGHNEIVKMAWGPSDGKIYTHDGNTSTIRTINPVNGASSIFANEVPGGRHGLNFDPAGRLIIGYEPMTDFYEVTHGGLNLLGHVSASIPNNNHGDGFGIQPDGNYVLYVDCGGQNESSINTTNHVDGTPFNSLAWTGTTNVFTLYGNSCGYSNGAIDPSTGDVYTTVTNFGLGNSKILFTAADGGPTSIFVSGAGDGNQQGITDLVFGKETGGGNCNSLYFVDRFKNKVYEVPMNNCCFPSPAPVLVSGSGTFCGNATLTASGGDGGTIYFQGTTKNGTSTAFPAATQSITSSGTYYFRSRSANGCWSRQGSATVTINPKPATPVISPEADLTFCAAGSTATLSIPASASSVVTYQIGLSNLVNMNNTCVNGGFYNCSGNAGFNWTDHGVGTVTNVEIKFSVGVECAGGTHTTGLNGSAAPGFTTTANCFCTAPAAPQIKTISFVPASYHVNGNNEFLFTNLANCLGLLPGAELNGSYAQVKVTYGPPPVLWSPGGMTGNSITVTPSNTTTYMVTVAGSYGCSSTASKTITIGGDNEKPTVHTKNLVVALDGTGQANITPQQVNNGSTDNCSIPATGYSLNKTSFDCSNIGDNTVILTVTDAYGNSQTGEATVTVQDHTAPVPNLANLPDITGECSVTVATAPTATDNCRGTVTGVTTDPVTYSSQGEYIITWKYDDGHGNTITQTQKAIVKDITPPVILNCPANIHLNNGDPNPTWVAPTVTDNCGGASIVPTSGPVPGDPIGYGETKTVVYTATDNVGNISTCSFTITRSSTLAAYAVAGTISCFGGSTTVTVTASGGIAPYTGDGMHTVQAGPYSFTVTDASGSSTVVTGTIDQPSKLVVTVSNTNLQLYYGYSEDQTTQIKGQASGGTTSTGKYTFKTIMDRALLCDVITSSGDESVTPGGSCNKVLNYVTTATSSIVSATLLQNAKFYISATDDNGCVGNANVATVYAEDVRCFSGNSGKSKVAICHRTGSNNNPCTAICVSESAVDAHLAHGDFLGNCTANCEPPPQPQRSVSVNITPEAKALDIIVMNNPSPGGEPFRLKVVSNIHTDDIRMRIMDAAGKPMANKPGLRHGQTVEIGTTYLPGIYYAEVRQGTQRKLVKLIKQ